MLARFKGRGEWFDLRCPQCKHDYHGQAGVDIASIALSRVEEEFGPIHGNTAVALNNVGNAYGDLGDYHKRKELVERALVMEEREYGPTHAQVAITMCNLGNAQG